jgi:hypothetical protein
MPPNVCERGCADLSVPEIEREASSGEVTLAAIK